MRLIDIGEAEEKVVGLTRVAADEAPGVVDAEAGAAADGAPVNGKAEASGSGEAAEDNGDAEPEGGDDGEGSDA